MGWSNSRPHSYGFNTHVASRMRQAEGEASQTLRVQGWGERVCQAPGCTRKFKPRMAYELGCSGTCKAEISRVRQAERAAARQS